MRLVVFFIMLFIMVAFSAQSTGVEQAIYIPPPTPTPPPQETYTPVYVPITIEETPPEPPEPSFYEWLDELTTEEKIGQLFMLRLPWQTLYVNERVENLFERVPMGGIILFGDNVDSIEQVQTLTTDLQGLARIPLIISTDEEGGRVSRVGRLFEPLPAPYEIARYYNEDFTYQNAEEQRNRLLSLGINMNLAPVTDIWSNPDNAVIGTRAFGRTAEEAAPHVAASVRGLRGGGDGVMSVLKHFPGHGDTYEDSHYYLAVFHHNRERWASVEALPFISGIDAGADGVMIGHIATPQIAGHTPLLYWMQPWIDNGYLPATFSDYWLTDTLRGELGFDGLVITDALDMRALTDHFTCAQISVGAFLAGADILLMPLNSQEAFNALLQAYNDGTIAEERLNASLRRIFYAKGG